MLGQLFSWMWLAMLMTLSKNAMSIALFVVVKVLRCGVRLLVIRHRVGMSMRWHLDRLVLGRMMLILMLWCYSGMHRCLVLWWQSNLPRGRELSLEVYYVLKLNSRVMLPVVMSFRILVSVVRWCFRLAIL